MKSKHVVDLKKNGYNIKASKKVYTNIISKRGVDIVFAKADKAYASGGDKAMSKREWGYARLASAILGRGARAVDRGVWLKYKK